MNSLLSSFKSSKFFYPSLISAATGVLSLLYYVSRLQKKESQISSIYVYPLKSVGGMAVDAWPVVETGFMYDRQWMIVREEDNLFVTQRQIPAMALIKAVVSLEGVLTLSNPEGDSIQVPTLREKEGNTCREVEIWEEKFQAIDCGEEAAKFLSKFLNKKVRLVETPKDLQREPGKDHRDMVLLLEKGASISPGEERHVKTTFADAFPFLLANEDSLADLQKLIPSETLQMVRFRPNIVVKNTPKAYAEDTWQTIDIYPATPSNERKLRVFNIKPCVRCTIPAVNPETGKRNLDVKKVLDKHRAFEGFDSPLFGVNLIHELGKDSVVLKVGDKVKVVTTQKPLARRATPL